MRSPAVMRTRPTIAAATGTSQAQIERRWNDLEEGSPTRGPHRRRDTGCQFLELIGFHLVTPLGLLDPLRTSLSRGPVGAIGVTTHLWARNKAPQHHCVGKRVGVGLRSQ